jgi:hypothetical protein
MYHICVGKQARQELGSGGNDAIMKSVVVSRPWLRNDQEKKYIPVHIGSRL